MLDWSLRPRPNADHFGDFNEMVGHRMPAVSTSAAGLGDDGDEVAEVVVFEHAREIAGGLEFRTSGIDALDSLKRVAGCWDWQ
jgi:hypothetical protein